MLLVGLIWPTDLVSAEGEGYLQIIKVQIKDRSRPDPDKCSNGSEFVLIENLSESEIDLNGFNLIWGNQNSDSGHYKINQSAMLDSGRRVVFYNSLFNLGNSNCQPNPAAQQFIDSQQLSFEIASVQGGRFSKSLNIRLNDSEGSLATSLEYQIENNSSDTVVLNKNYTEITDIKRLDYNLAYDELYQPPPQINQCQGIALSEIGIYLDQPFIELYNSSVETVKLTNCQLVVNDQTHVFDQIKISPSQILALSATDLGLELKQDSLIKLLTEDNQPIDQFGYQYNSEIDQASLIPVGGDGDNWQVSYQPTPNQNNVYQALPNCPEGYIRNQSEQCVLIKPLIEISEVNYASPKKNQFIELHNLGDQAVDLSDFLLVDNWNHSYQINDKVIAASEYLTLFYDQTKFDFDNQASNQLKLISFDQQTVIDQVELEPLSKDKTWIKIDEQWDWSFQPTPGLVNQSVKAKTCNSGYHWDNQLEKCRANTIAGHGSGAQSDPNDQDEVDDGVQSCQSGYEVGYTGTCVKKCGLGQYRSKTTNRCRNYQVIEATFAKAVTKTACQAGYEIGFTGSCVKKCGAGQYRSKTTNRCRNYQLASASSTKTKQSKVCQSGYEIGYTGTCVKKCKSGFVRNQETNRCRRQTAAELTNDNDNLAEIEQTVFVPPDSEPKLDWWKLVNNPLFGAIVGAGGVLIYTQLGPKK